MGLFSKLKKGLSKAWGGIRKTVKTVARTVKKVSKKIAYATPIGKKLWDFSSKVGKGIMKGVGKIASKLGPVGMMALSFVLAPVVGPLIGALWGSFGAGAAAMAASANAFVSTLGSVGSGIFAAGNFVGGTLGALGSAVTEGARNVLVGNFSGAAQAFASNISAALTGKAGMASVNAAAAQAASQAGTLVGQSEAVSGLAGPVGPVEPTSGLINMDSSLMPVSETVGSSYNFGIDSVDVMAAKIGEQVAMKPIEAQVSQAVFGTAGSMGLTEADAFIKFGREGVAAIQPDAMLARPKAAEAMDNIRKAKDNYDKISGLLGDGGAQGSSGFQPYTPRMIKSHDASSGANAQGQGSAGFSLLGGVQGLEESVRRSQQMMFS